MANQMQRALISVSDKTGIVALATALQEQGIEIISTGGTARLLQENGIKVMSIEEVTGFPEILDGRVKTLHPYIHSGLLARRDRESHRQQLAEHRIMPIDLVVVNLYPFAETIAQDDVSFAEAVENIDIGGPSMLRAAAKNHAHVTVVTDVADYDQVLSEIKDQGEVQLETRRRLAAKVFRHTAAYDSLIAQYMTDQVQETKPEKLTVTFEKAQDLRYGENPHQQAAFYRQPNTSRETIAGATQLHGKALSYNNIQDANAALQLVQEFTQPTAVAIKHTNPCGVGTGATIQEAFERAFAADPVSIFGGIVALNREVDQHTAKKLHDIFLEIIIAPSFSAEALNVLTKKKNVRLLQVDQAVHTDRDSIDGRDSVKREGINVKGSKPTGLGLKTWRFQSVSGGLLAQEQDAGDINPQDCQVVTEKKPTDEEWEQLMLAWKVVKHVKSNAIVLVKDGQTVGIGAGQMNRVGAAKIAIEQAGEQCSGSVLASDAFFPMPDTVQAAAKAGVTTLIQPGGSKRDEDSIQAANEHGLSMVFTGVRHFKH